MSADSTFSPAYQRGDDEPESLTPFDQQVMHLQKQLDIECKVKQGADNMIAKYSSAPARDKKLLLEVQQMSADSKAKIEYLRMRLKKLQQTKEARESENERNKNGGGGDNGMEATNNSSLSLEDTLERRIEELRHHLRIESACLEGAKNAIKLLQSTKNPDKKALHEVK